MLLDIIIRICEFFLVFLQFILWLQFYFDSIMLISVLHFHMIDISADITNMTLGSTLLHISIKHSFVLYGNIQPTQQHVDAVATSRRLGESHKLFHFHDIRWEISTKMTMNSSVDSFARTHTYVNV